MKQNHFALFGLTPVFDVDLAALTQNYRKLQSESHPDRFVSATPAEKLQSMQLATIVNEAYQTLKHPATRAKYLLSLENIDATKETNTSMPADFLMQQMEWREQLEDSKVAKDVPGLENLHTEMQQAANTLSTALAQLFDENDLAGATEDTRKLIFIDKVCADIDKAIGTLED